MGHLLLLRHGQSTNNLPNHCRLKTPRLGEHELTSLGKSQAQAFAQWAERDAVATETSASGFEKPLLPQPINTIWVSPMLRTLQTAEIIRSHLRFRCEIVVDLHEWGGLSERYPSDPSSLCSGNGREALHVSFPAMIVPSEVASNGWWHSQIRESPEECWQRGKKLLSKLTADCQHTNVLLITHAWFSNVLARILSGAPGHYGWWETEWREICHTGWSLWDTKHLPSEPLRWNCADHLGLHQRTQ